MKLPQEKYIPVNLLSAVFNNTSSTYKFYWLLSILQEIEENKTEISKLHLFARMISNAWYTVNYFRISLGKQDLIQESIKSIIEWENISIDEKLNTVFESLLKSKNDRTARLLWNFNRYVPHLFLSPWFPGKNTLEIYKSSKNFSGKCLYSLYEDRIIINPDWRNYLISNSRFIKDYCFWNLTVYLQAKNPNVPDIPNKLIKPALRNSLILQRKKYWDLVFEELHTIKCIYTGNSLSLKNYALEHFIPYNFVSHDLMWNLIPADKKFNSSKGDKLPPIDKFFDPFYDLQKVALEIVSRKYSKNKFLEDYLTIFSNLNSITRDKFKSIVEPLSVIASNNGFEILV